MSEQITIGLLIDSSQADAQIAATQAKVDETVSLWKQHRSEIMLGLSAVNQLVAITAKLTSKTADAAGRSVMRILQSLLSTVNSAFSTMVAVAAGLAASGIFAPIAAALVSFAFGMSIGQTAAIIQTEGQVLAEMAAIKLDLARVQAESTQLARGGI